MGFLKEKVIVELNGYLVVEITIPQNGYKTYSTARGTREKYVFIYRAGEKTSFTDLKECESYFSGLVTNEIMVKQLNERGQLLVSETILPVMARVRELFSQLK